MSKYYKEKYDVIVIGASLAGLASALTLLPKGFDVLVLEQHNLPGGVATSFSRGGVEIEASLHEMMSIGEKDCPLKIRRFLEENGVNVDWIRVPIAYRYIDPDTDVVIHAGKNGDFSVPSKEIADACGDIDGSLAKRINNFLNLCLRCYNSLDYLSIHELSKLKMIKDHPDFVRTLGYGFEDVAKKFDLPQKAIDILIAYWIYIGTPTDDMPFTIGAYLLADYLGYGSYIPRMTSHELALKMMEQVIAKGAQVELNQRVNKILVKDNKVYGVRLASGEEIHAPYVISGAYPNTVFSKMIEPKSEVPAKAIKWTNSMELGVSCFSVVMMLDRSYEELGIKDYATFYAPYGNRTRKIYDSGKELNKWEYITSICTNIAHENASPKGTCIYSITYLPDGDSFKGVTAENYHEYKDKIVNHFLEMESKRLGVNLKDHILEIIIETPVTISHYTGAYMGTIYGYRHSLKNHAVARKLMDKNEHYISGLAFAGSHQVSGDGMGPAITNGRKGAKDIIDEDKARKAGR